jgi:ubiquinone/menaquinone biosynthesis C-methylase UbiE
MSAAGRKEASSTGEIKGCGPDCVYQNELAQPAFPGGGNWGIRSYFRSAASEYLKTTYDKIPSSPAPPSNRRPPTDPMDARSLTKYYTFNLAELAPQFVPLVKPFAPDEETQRWLDTCKPEMCVSLIASVLRHFMSVTDVNGLLRRGQMFVFSQAMVQDLLFGERGGAMAEAISSPPASSAQFKRTLGKLLDVGAGDGGVTEQFAPFFESVSATEVSAQMVKRLKERGYTVFHTPYINAESLPGVREGSFDVVCFNNLLDRCDHPGSMLSDARRLLNPATGRLIISVVLPFSEFVEEGTVRRRPYGALPMNGHRCSDAVSLEDSLSALLTRAIIPAGFDVISISKLPYLCRGDRVRPYYVLADAIIVCRPRLTGGDVITAGSGDASSAGYASADAPKVAFSSSSTSTVSSRIPLRPGASISSADIDTFGGSDRGGQGQRMMAFGSATKAE